MLDALYIGATGMNAQQLQVEAIANNLANVNTNGYKKNRVSFEDLLYRDVAGASALVDGEFASPRLGIGVAVAAAGKIFTDGELKRSDSPLDFAIRGRGFFEVLMPDGGAAYTRAGNFSVDRDGFLATADGRQLRPLIQVPSEARELVVDANGRLSALLPGERDRTDLGQIELVDFVNPGALAPIGDNLYQANERSGQPILGKPGEVGLGAIAQGFVESSNVKLVEELVSLVVAQRAYEINSKIVQASDEMLGIINGLRR
jgi:flagellar basal-body rod protein FlgG